MLKPRYFLPFWRVGNKKAIVFLHGLLGEVGVWTAMKELLRSDPELADWDMFSLGYPTTVLFHPFSEELSLDSQSEQLYANLILPPISEYESLAFVAHSAGGLVLQRVLVDFEDVRQRTSHVFFFGTPSRGSHRARQWKFLNSQVRDMATGSSFIQCLRQDWKAKFQDAYPFHLEVVVGEDDNYVRPASVRQPFSETPLEIVPGDHDKMIQPASPDAPAFQIVSKGLKQPRPPTPPQPDRRRWADRSGKIFVSYSHEDIDWLTSVTDVLTLAMGRDSLNTVWDDRQLQIGDKWHKRLDDALAHAGFAVLLVTTPFLASQFVREEELPTLLRRSDEGVCRLFPITISAINYDDPRMTGVEKAKALHKQLLEVQFANELKLPLAKVGKALQGTELTKIAGKIKSTIEADEKRR